MVFILFKLLFEILKLSYHWEEMLKERIYEETFVVSSRGASRRYVSSSSRNYVVRMPKLFCLVVWILLHQVNACVHILLNKQMKHTKKLLLYFTCHPGCLYLCIFCPSKTSFNILSDLLLYRYSIETFEDDRALNVKVSFNRRFLSPIFIFFDE